MLLLLRIAMVVEEGKNNNFGGKVFKKGIVHGISGLRVFLHKICIKASAGDLDNN